MHWISGTEEAVLREGEGQIWRYCPRPALPNFTEAVL